MDAKQVLKKMHQYIADCDPNFIWFKDLGWPEDFKDRGNGLELTDREGNKFVLTITAKD